VINTYMGDNHEHNVLKAVYTSIFLITLKLPQLDRYPNTRSCVVEDSNRDHNRKLV
jgi:hypothetical protein